MDGLLRRAVRGERARAAEDLACGAGEAHRVRSQCGTDHSVGEAAAVELAVACQILVAAELLGPFEDSQHAVRQAKQLGTNIALVLHGRTPSAYVHRHVGSVASLGLHKGVAQVYGIKLRGFPAWFMHRTYHMSRVPTFNRKVRVVLDWTLALFFKREVVSLGSLQDPRAEFSEASR